MQGRAVLVRLGVSIEDGVEWKVKRRSGPLVRDEKAGSYGGLPAFYRFAGEVKVWARRAAARLSALVRLLAQAELAVWERLRLEPG